MSHQLPSILSHEDATQLIQTTLRSRSGAVLIGDSVVVSQSLLHKIVVEQEAEMETR